MKSTVKLLVILLISLIYVSCDDDNVTPTQNAEGNVQMSFKVTYDGMPLVLSNDYQYPDGKEMYFSKLTWYMSDLSFSTEQGATASSDAISLLNIGKAHTTAALAENGYTINLNDVKSGNYNDISFNIGVPAEQNAMEPSDFDSSSDLHLSGEYWANWESYIFFKLEGMIDLDNDDIPESEFVLHLGADNALTAINLDKEFVVNDDETTEVVIPVELRNFFLNGSEVYDIVANPTIHLSSQNDLVIQFSKNLKTCF